MFLTVRHEVFSDSILEDASQKDAQPEVELQKNLATCKGSVLFGFLAV